MALPSEIKKTGAQIEITVTVPHSRVGGALEKVYDDAAKEIEIRGFRKGQAPKNLVREKVDKAKAYGEVINRLVPDAYNAAVKEYLLKPIVSPRIELVQFEPETEKDFVFKATTTERPTVQLGDYQSELKKLKVQKPTEGIIGPDGKPLKFSKPTSGGSSLNDILQSILKTATVEIPEILVENEVNRILSRLIDQTAQLGLTVEQYLQSQSKTAEQLRADYAQQAKENLKVEFVLEEIAQAEKIEVTDQEIADAIKAAPDQKSKEELAKEENKWYIKSILKRNKTIQRLLDLTK